MENILDKIRDIVSDEFDKYTLFCSKPGIHIATEKVATEGCWPQYVLYSGLCTNGHNHSGYN